MEDELVRDLATTMGFPLKVLESRKREASAFGWGYLSAAPLGLRCSCHERLWRFFWLRLGWFLPRAGWCQFLRRGFLPPKAKPGIPLAPT